MTAPGPRSKETIDAEYRALALQAGDLIFKMAKVFPQEVDLIQGKMLELCKEAEKIHRALADEARAKSEALLSGERTAQ